MKTRLQRNIDPYWLPHPPCSGAFRHWLVEEGSLTRRLQACCKHFTVRNVRQSWARPLPDEAALLGLRPGTAAWVREVWLHDGDVPLVFARSILPRSSMRGAWRKLGSLGSRPLGEALFADARVMRRPLAYRKLRPGHPVLKNVARNKALWARRSVFVRAGHAILVTEAFLPEVLAL
ncbi:MAG TPA: chorismate lyase [Novimethylophilus sp.]|uniref:chorismate--pyruvate lyase family protein n=1 Tax=Novimethylophilus sp. TaxID=2137426 RepID=UPI002F42DF8B